MGDFWGEHFDLADGEEYFRGMNPKESLILEALRFESFEMPPDNPLDKKVIAPSINIF